MVNAPRGTRDLFGNDILSWRKVENEIIKLANEFGFNQIKTPMFEHTELFSRGVGETTDIVQKEMYSFKDKGGRDITLKPEGTACVVRSYLQNKMYAGIQPTKLFYITPCFRYERPQAGRLRQFHQFGIECFGSSEPTADAEVISVAYTLLKRFDLKNIELHINSLGGPECRKKYNESLKNFLSNNIDKLCPTCQERFEKNPLRVLDCKEEKCQEVLKGAPVILDVLGPECKEHFNKVQNLLKAMDIEFVVDPYIVRGLDYYTRTVFEFVSKDIGSQGTVCGGGRYDKLIEECGGKPSPAVGFGIGIERLILVIEAQKGKKEYEPKRDIFIGYIGDEALIKAHALTFNLRQSGISAESDLLKKSVKAQMKYANKIGAKYTLILGDDELSSNKASLKDMENGENIDISLDRLSQTMTELLKNK